MIDGSRTQDLPIRDPLTTKTQTYNRFKRTLFISTKPQSANVRGIPLCQATKMPAVILVSDFR